RIGFVRIEDIVVGHAVSQPSVFLTGSNVTRFPKARAVGRGDVALKKAGVENTTSAFEDKAS
ncbi:hypothetical protein, partial [Bifidobacterium sp. UBA6881]|uniref:hypothetical protein n=1 Tax=Bifidobacterium sp. UBA6881 TaxID=1946109 RepID=UPI0025C09651